MSSGPHVALGWLGIVRLGLVQTSLGAIVVLTTAALNRVMVVEHQLPATVPGLLVSIHYAVQLLRPRLGYGSDRGGRRTPWIVGGMAVLGMGGVLAAAATALMGTMPLTGILLAAVAFLLVGLGVGAAGTSLLVLLAGSVAPVRRPAAASLVWIMMIAGFVITTAATGRLLDPYSPERLIAVTAGVAAIAFVVSLLAVAGVEGHRRTADFAASTAAPFMTALKEVWSEPVARHFTVFVFISMLAYSAQDLVLEPFSGAVFGLTLGESTSLSAVQHGGVLAGMILTAVAGTLFKGSIAILRHWIMSGCVLALVVLVALALAHKSEQSFPLRETFFVLGLANGAFAAGAIAAMMQLVASGQSGREGIRMGLFGAAQAIAFGLGGLVGTIILDLGRLVTGSVTGGYTIVFLADALLFLVSAILALRIGKATPDQRESFTNAAPAT